jgi:twinfilin-like protein
MSASSGIQVSSGLSDAFAQAVSNQGIRFVLVVIKNEELTLHEVVPKSGALSQDLARLPSLMPDNSQTPCYILTSLDADGSMQSDWLIITFIPDSASVRDKMLYASSRASLTKALGAYRFTDAIFANGKDELTPEAYAEHRKHATAPLPMSARENEIAEIRAAESQQGQSFQGLSGRRSHVGTGIGLTWTREAESAVLGLSSLTEPRLVVLAIDASNESLQLAEEVSCDIRQISGKLPTQDPSYAFFCIPTQSSQIGFIYSCPSTSPIKHRMIYASGVGSVVQSAKTLLAVSSIKKFEVSDPTELDLTSMEQTESTAPDRPIQTFARPKGPTRRR